MEEIKQGEFDLESGELEWKNIEELNGGRKTFATQATSFLSAKLAEDGYQVEYCWLERERRRPAIKMDGCILQVSTTAFREAGHKRPHSVMLCPNQDKAKRKPYHIPVGIKYVYDDVTHFVIILLDEEQKSILLRYPDVSIREYAILRVAEIYVLSKEQVVHFFEERPKNKAISQGKWRLPSCSLRRWLEGFEKREKREGF